MSRQTSSSPPARAVSMSDHAITAVHTSGLQHLSEVTAGHQDTKLMPSSSRRSFGRREAAAQLELILMKPRIAVLPCCWPNQSKERTNRTSWGVMKLHRRQQDGRGSTLKLPPAGCHAWTWCRSFLLRFPGWARAAGPLRSTWHKLAPLAIKVLQPCTACANVTTGT